MSADVYRNGRFEADPWEVIADDAELPAAVPVIVSAARLAGLDAALPPARLGLLLAAGDAVPALAPLLPRVALVAVTFPKFNDGRGFSQGRLIVERHGFAGELRAVGEVLIDQIPLMLRVGFTAFKVEHGPTRRALDAGHLPSVRYHYQPDADSGAHSGAAPVAGRRWIGAV